MKKMSSFFLLFQTIPFGTNIHSVGQNSFGSDNILFVSDKKFPDSWLTPLRYKSDTRLTQGLLHLTGSKGSLKQEPGVFTS